MKGINSQKGQALILIAFGIVALIGFTALAVDGGRVFSDRRNAQNAADTSALAAALEYIQQESKSTAKTKGVERAASNGYVTDIDSNVTVEFCDEAADKCQDPIKKELSLGDKPAEFIRVTITSDVPMTFARVLGRNLVTNRVVAIARVQGTTTTSLFNAGAGLYSVKDGNSDDCFKVNGSADLVLHDTGIFVNCGGNSALFLNGSAKIGMGANARVVGCTNNPSFPITGTGTIDCNVAPQPVSKSTFKDVPTAPSTPNCASPGGKSGNTWSPGYYSSNMSISSSDFLSDGKYCFINGAEPKLTGGASMKGGKVTLVLSDDLDLKGDANQFESLEIFMNNADFTIFGTLTADRFRFFGNGNSSFGVQSGVFTSGDAYIYSESGEVDIQAQAVVNMHAPPQGDTFGGMLIYMPWDNPNSFELNGGTSSTWYGTVLVPHADVTYNGDAGFKLYGQVIGYTFKINGGGKSDIFFDSDVVFSPPNDPTIEFTK